VRASISIGREVARTRAIASPSVRAVASTSPVASSAMPSIP
jgi:hypothetical protein